MTTHLGEIARHAVAGVIASAVLTAFPARAQAPLWPDAPWRAFVTGDYPQGFLPTALASGDLDGDGDVDVLVGMYFFGAPGVSVLENAGNGTYLPPVFYSLPINQSVGEVALADFDSDGDLDAFATIRGVFDDQTKLLVWRNDGAGTLAAPVEFTTGVAPVGLVVADFTGDGKPDVATANYAFSERTISFLRHNGQTGAGAGFLPHVDIDAGMRAEDLAAADLNGDGHLDLAVGGFQDTNVSYVAVMLGDGDGGFAAPVPYEAAPGGYPLARSRVALADLDNDGDPDLITGGAYEDGSILSGAIIIRRNDGQGVFGDHQAFVLPEGFNDPWSLSAADLTADGFADVVAAIPSGRAVDGYVVLPSNGAGGFHAPAYYEAEQWSYAADVFDGDGDGDVDVATIAGFSSALTIHTNPGDGHFGVLTRYALAELTDGFDAADIDNDGDIDVVTNNLVSILVNDAVIVVWKNNGDGTFAPGGSYVYAPPRNFGEIKLRDLNGDGFVDMLLAPDDDFPPYNFGTAVNNGNGTFAQVVVQPVDSCGQGSIDAFDLDGDGDLDVVLTEEQGCPSVPQPRIFVFRNDGNMAFTLVNTIVSTNGFPRGIAGADLNGDGRIDLVTALSTTMGVFLNNGNFSFSAPVLSSTSPYKFRLADFDGDGKLDLGMIMPQTEVFEVDVATALGLGGGVFAPPQTQQGSTVGESLRISDDLDVADFDGDSRPDLLTFNYASNDLSVFLTDDNGALLKQQRYGIGNTPLFGAVADFNGDGRPDVAAAIGLPPYGLDNALVVLRSVAITPVSLVVDAAGNGVLEPGETVVVTPGWGNSGVAAIAVTGAASNFTGPAGPSYTLQDGAADYGSLPAGGTGDCFTATGDCYELGVSGARPQSHWDATFDEALSSGTARTWTLHVGESFADVPTSHPFYRFVEIILHNGVTGGCGGADYCPESQTRRDQMAVFVLKAKEGQTYVPPACTGVFADAPCPGPFTDWIEELARRGVVAGCGGGNYCPDSPVLRQQMAVFLLKTLLGSGYVPPTCAGLFGDVPCASPFAGWVEDLFNRGITGGCGGGNYCPTAVTTRGQMAVFIQKTFALLLYGP